MQFKIKPEIYETKNGEPILDENGEPKNLLWEGHIVVDIPGIEEQTAIKAESMKWSKKGPNGEDVWDVAASSKKMREVAAKAVKEINLTHKETGLVFTNIEELSQMAEWQQIVNYVYGVCVNGPKLRTVLRDK